MASQGTDAPTLNERLIPEQTVIRLLYEVGLQRPPDEVGFEGWVTALENGMSLADLFRAFFSTPEFRSQNQFRYPSPTVRGDKFYFVHIPKTAGTAIRRFLQTMVPTETLFTPFVMNDLLRSTISLDSYTYFTGHFLGMLDISLSQKTRKATLLRHPATRTISHFLHFKRDPAARYHHLYKNVTLEEMLSIPESRQIFGNYQAKYMQALGVGVHYLQAPFWEWADRSSRENEGKLFAAARQVLSEEIELVGLSENHSAFCRRLAQAWSLNAQHYEFRENVATNRIDIPSPAPDLLGIIEQWNEVDMELYKFAKQDLVGA